MTTERYQHLIKPNISDLDGDFEEEEEALDDYRRRFHLQTEHSRPRRQPRRNEAPLFRDAAEEPLGRITAERVEAVGDEGFKMTYKPARYEAIWLRTSLRSFFEQELIVDVLAQIKGGKEANVYRCQAHPRVGPDLLAVKVYRPRQFRNLTNDKMYREGREILKGDGGAVKRSDHRIMRALGKRTAFGEQVQHTSWLMHEYTTLERLYAAGGAVPRAVAANANAILMGYVGDARRAASALQELRLGSAEAASLFTEVLRNVELMLECGLIHGDLSAYNLLYWEKKLTLIDFPQVTDLAANPNAHFILRRDIQRVCEYFARQGVNTDPLAILDDLWARYGEPENTM